MKKKRKTIRPRTRQRYFPKNKKRDLIPGVVTSEKTGD